MARKPTSICAICGKKYEPNDSDKKFYCPACAVASNEFHSLAHELIELQPENDARRGQIIHRMAELDIVLRYLNTRNLA